MTAKEVLISAKESINAPDKWLKKLSCRCDNGVFRRCALNAIVSVSGSGVNTEYVAATKIFIEANAIQSRSIMSFNDAEDMTHDKMMKAFDNAIFAAG